MLRFPPYNFRFDLRADGCSSKQKVQLQMLNRVLAGLLHPFISLAYGPEFGIPGQISLDFLPTRTLPNNLTHNSHLQAWHRLQSTRLTKLGSIPLHQLSTGRIPLQSHASPRDRRRSRGLRYVSVSLSVRSREAAHIRFHRRIRDHPALRTVEHPSFLPFQYKDVANSAGSTTHALVLEQTEEWLAGLRARGGVDAEAWLRGCSRGSCRETLFGSASAPGRRTGPVDAGSTPIFLRTSSSVLLCQAGLTLAFSPLNAHLVALGLFLPKLVFKDEA